MMVCAFAERGLATGKGTKTKGPPGQQKMPELSDYVKVPKVRANIVYEESSCSVVFTEPSISTPHIEKIARGIDPST